MGESIAEATILKWLKQPGDAVELDEAILEIATDKVDSEVPSPVDGVIEKLLFNEGDVVAVGKAVAIISTDAAVANEPKANAPSEEKKAEELAKEVPLPAAVKEATPVAAPVTLDKPASDRFYSPLVLNIAKTEGIAMNELELVPGTGSEGRVTKKDILAYVKNRTAAPQIAPVSASASSAPAAAPVQHKVDVPIYPGDEIVEMDRMRKLIADHMVMSKHTSPHVTSMVEADMTNVVMWRNKVKNAFEAKYGEKITFTPIFLEAIVAAIKEMRGVNVSLSGDKIIKRKAINIGMATALPSGNLIVPVIHNADELSLLGLTKRVNDLAARARINKLKPEEIQGGTYTVTNVGTFGNVMGTPVINQPQVAIMATGAIQKKPAVLETPTGDVIAIRHKMFLSHSYDHRVVDGALGGSFVRKVADYLEAWDINREI
ncbi:MAG: 2-oxo acid dehydrogenase subunit E2 [Bacteroidetes bacterium]|nr:2-oxo acid dehydrogenase subunit E2 [Bacteroidota bacterium]